MAEITFKLGKMLENSVNHELKITAEICRKLGILMFQIIRHLFKDKLNFNITEERQDSLVDFNENMDLVIEDSNSIVYVEQHVEFSLNEDWF